MLYSPHAHAKVKSIDTSAAEKMPGVKAVHRRSPRRGRPSATRATTSPPWPPRPRSRPATPSAPSRSSTRSCPTSSPRRRRWPTDAPEVVKGGNVRKGRATDQGQARRGDGQGRRRRSRGRTRLPVITHVCLEPHGLTAKWDGADKIDRLGEHPGRAGRPPASWPTRSSIPRRQRHGPDRGHGRRVRLQVRRRRLGPHRRRAGQEGGGRPVKMFLDRVQEHLAAGNRPSATGQGQARGDQGRQARRHDRRDPRHRRQPGRLELPASLRLRRPGRRRGPTPTSSSTPAAPAPCGPRAIPRAAPSWKRPWTTWPTSWASTRSSSGSRTSPPDDFQHADLRGRGQDGGRADRLAEKRKPRGQNGNGADQARARHGPAPVGRRRHAGQEGRPARSTPTARSSSRRATQDIGTGARTVLAIIAAEVLGLKPTDIKSNIGNSTFPPGQPSGGSTTTPVDEPRRASTPSPRPATRCSRRSPRPSSAKPEDLSPQGRQALRQGRGRRWPGRTPAASSA